MWYKTVSVFFDKNKNLLLLSCNTIAILIFEWYATHISILDKKYKTIVIFDLVGQTFSVHFNHEQKVRCIF